MAIESSGNLIADRRFDYARGYQEAGDFSAAAELYEQMLELVPDFIPAWVELGEVRAKSGDASNAIAAYEKALQLDPVDRFGVTLKIARLSGSTPTAPPAAYVAGLFDDYAGRFEKALVEDLGYRTPWRLAEMIAATGRHYRTVLDLGCGTGLMAEALGPATIDGVDLSSGMVEKARAKGLYRNLAVADVTSHLLENSETYDLVIAADVFVYVGDLDAVFAAVRQRLSPGGTFAFSVEAGDDGLSLRDSLRYAHGEAYCRDLLLRHGFGGIICERSVIRQDRGAPIEGFLFLVRRTAQ